MTLHKKIYLYLVPIALSIILILWQHFGMNFSYQLSADDDIKAAMLNDDKNGGLSRAFVERRAGRITLDCHTISSVTFPFCSLLLPLYSDDKPWLDLSRYDRLIVTLDYRATQNDSVLVYLLNDETSQGNSLERANMYAITPVSGVATYTLALSRFNLPSWWVFNNPEFAQAGTRFDRVRYLQISTGDSRFERHVEIGFIGVEFQGKWLAAQDLYLVLVIVWLALAVVHATYNVRDLLQENKRATQQANELAQVNRLLSIEKEKYENLAKQDPLTNCLNRNGLRDILARVLGLYASRKIPAALIFLDIDYFKRINDVHGHAEGDLVLINLANLVRRHIREGDYLARWGGEEFAIICGNTTLKGAEGLAQNLRIIIGDSQLSTKVNVTCSFGVAELKAFDVKQWFNNADLALYEAKANGRNCVVLSSG